jgi:propionate CoA-transferase
LIGYPDYLVQGLEKRYVESNFPGNLTLFSGCDMELPTKLPETTVCPSRVFKAVRLFSPRSGPSVEENDRKRRVGRLCAPQGVLNQLYRCSAAKQPGLITKIGIGTYIDPRQDGGKINNRAKEDIVGLMNLGGEEWLFYQSFPITVALIRATTADESGT